MSTTLIATRPQPRTLETASTAFTGENLDLATLESPASELTSSQIKQLRDSHTHATTATDNKLNLPYQPLAFDYSPNNFSSDTFQPDSLLDLTAVDAILNQLDTLFNELSPANFNNTNSLANLAKLANQSTSSQRPRKSDTTSARDNLANSQNQANLQKSQLLNQTTPGKQAPNASAAANTTEANKAGNPEARPQSTNNRIYVVLPPGKKAVSTNNILTTIAERVYQDAGIKVSKAAIEEAIGRGLLFEKQDFIPGILRDSQGKVLRDENQQPLIGYAINIEPSAYTALLGFRAEAEQITRAGIPAVHDLTEEQRRDYVINLFLEKHSDVHREALEQLFSGEHLVRLIAEKTLQQTLGSGPAAIGIAAYQSVVDLPQLHGLLLDLKRLTYAPKKPSDLETAAAKLAILVETLETSLLTGALEKGTGKALQLGKQLFDKLPTPFAAAPGATPVNGSPYTPIFTNIPTNNTRTTITISNLPQPINL
jgi:hypothetical protein